MHLYMPVFVSNLVFLSVVCEVILHYTENLVTIITICLVILWWRLIIYL